MIWRTGETGPDMVRYGIRGPSFAQQNRQRMAAGRFHGGIQPPLTPTGPSLESTNGTNGTMGLSEICSQLLVKPHINWLISP